MQKITRTILWPFLFTVGILFLGYVAFGLWTTLLFTFGFLGGFIAWVFSARAPNFSTFKMPFWLAFSFFLLHRIEEKVASFFPKLAQLTGVPTPEITSIPVILLVLTSVGAWLSIPWLVKRGSAWGYYLAWTFFASMGITELAHFILPLFVKEPYGYFPGMISVIPLAPTAWWGMCQLRRGKPV